MTEDDIREAFRTASINDRAHWTELLVSSLVADGALPSPETLQLVYPDLCPEERPLALALERYGPDRVAELIGLDLSEEEDEDET